MKEPFIAIACVMFALAGIVFSEETNAPVQNLPEWKDKTIQEMIADLGTPTNELSYTISNAPTKGWNHGVIFSVYPKNIFENQNVIIKEYVWNQGQYEVRACCHLMKNRWLVMGATRIDKRVRF